MPSEHFVSDGIFTDVLFVKENQCPRQNICLQEGEETDKATENQAVFHGEAEQVGFLAL